MTNPPRFHRLALAEIRRMTPGAVSLSFAVPPSLVADFAFSPGQYLTLRATVDGEDLRRSYSISSGPDDGDLSVAVKQVEDGAFSTWVNQALKTGDQIDVMTPTGRFGLNDGFRDGRVHAGFAAGSGITPILSILRGVLTREPTSRFFLFYGSRSVEDILFRGELEELKDRFLGRLSLFHVLSREEQDVGILNGRLDGEKARLLLRHVVPAASIDHAFVCGPEGMIDDLEAALKDMGLAPEKIHVERFVSAHGGRPRPAPPRADAVSVHKISIVVDGNRREVPAAAGETILDAALRAGLDLPFSCKGGMCCTCRARIVEGAAPMDVDYSLEPWEVGAGFVLTCQAKPTSAGVAVDFDHV
jgi:ring-1,2-phenylacetyl-CoA epoxidase subunit PaaE